MTSTVFLKWLCFTMLVIIFCHVGGGARLSGRKMPPVILVPGDGGSQIEAKINRTTAPHFWCKTQADWFLLWLNIELLVLPLEIECVLADLSLQYNSKTRKTSDPPGVITRITDFGNTSTVEWLDSSKNIIGAYFCDIAQALVKELNYTRGVDLRGAPYDFRRAPNELQQYLQDLKTLIENTYKINGNTPVILIGHSMGNNMLLYHLNHQSQGWKDKFIHSYVSLAGPWGGAAKAVRLMASGDNLGDFLVNPLTVRGEQRSMPSTAWLLPSDKVWSSEEILVQSPKRNYTVKDYQQLMTDLNFTDGWEMRKDTQHFIYDLEAPGVELHCLHGQVDKQTPASFQYKKDVVNWYDSGPTVVNGDGDGTVNMKSLLACLRWKGKNHNKAVYHQVFPKNDHLGVLYSPEVIKYIINHVKNAMNV